MDEQKMKELSIKYGEEILKQEGAFGSLLLGCLSPNALRGLDWAFLTGVDAREFMRNIDEGKKHQLYKWHIKLRDGSILVQSDIEAIYGKMDLARKLGLITREDIEEGMKRRMESIQAFDKFCKQGKGGYVGIYNQNESDTITIKGKRYHAFAVDAGTLIRVTKANNRKFKLGSGVYSPDEVLQKINQVIENLTLAPSGNALMIEIV